MMKFSPRAFSLALLLTTCVVGLTTPAFSASVFKVSNGENTLYIGGTLHLLSESDYPLPNAYDTAYQHSETLVFETDLDALETQEFAQSMMKKLTYTQGNSLADDLSEKTIANLSAHMEARGLSLSNFMMYKPAFLSITLSMIELQIMGLTSEGVDKHFFNRGKNDNKTILWLESPEQQLSFIQKMGNGDEDAFIQYTLEDIETLPQVLPKMKSSWKAGDIDKMYEESMADFKSEYPDIFDTLLSSRNKSWMQFLVEALATKSTEFVLVGALHLPGELGVLNMLEQQGFSVEKVQ
ncbi:TraB/GumN family protein [Alteromonas sp. CI.11.F.A3]|uniref:TraB/GumN family protein n=1 Tax=Alteromonas sp. CI.11.F.A3 TaxID=3079555 RepID=UPI0029421838|nr:TraB/GumN family protein [Alteromonas sp. CI.11.F.A3]WOI38953.1 TraB/GumN family protein [Alteromonas sp. CI.11.F.A3]